MTNSGSYGSRRDDLQLLKHDQGIPDLPALDDLPALQPLPPDAWHLHTPPSRGDSGEFAILHSRAIPACHNGIPLGDAVLDMPVGVGERHLIGQHRSAGLDDPLWAVGDTGNRGVVVAVALGE